MRNRPKESSSDRHLRARRAKWTWEPRGAGPLHHTMEVPCGMVTSTGKRCAKGWFHNGSHSSKEPR